MIHEFKNGHWLPGPDHRDGSKPFPDHPPAGSFFNDVTGVAGPTQAAVEEGLTQLVMKWGSLPAVVPVAIDLHGLVDRLRAEPESVRELGRDLGTAVLRPDETMFVTQAPGRRLALAQEAGRLALALMRANGQMDYIRRQPWFRQGTHQVVLHLESQFTRETEYLKFHKDTGGDVLFSNLVFRNSAGLPATEWSLDLEPMPPGKRALVSRTWPAALLAAVDEARVRLAPPPDHEPVIHGGALPADGYLSWVDELIWHSTPWLEHRMCHTPEEVGEALEDPGFSMLTYDLMAQVAQTPGSRFAACLAERALPLEALSEDKAEQLWNEMHRHQKDRALFEAFQQDARAIDWSRRKQDTAWAISLIRDVPGRADQHLTIQPSGMLGRPRSNSENLRALKNHPGSDQDRDFIQVNVSVRPRH